jgi:hypothetical protein
LELLDTLKGKEIACVYFETEYLPKAAFTGPTREAYLNHYTEASKLHPYCKTARQFSDAISVSIPEVRI